MDIFGLAGTAFNVAQGAMALDSEVAAFHEKQRREQRGFDQLTSEVQARGGAASGFAGSSVSLTNYLKSLTEEFTKQKDWSESDFRAAQDAKSMSLFFSTASDIGSMVMSGMGSYGGGSGLGGGGGSGGSVYDSIMRGFKPGG